MTEADRHARHPPRPSLQQVWRTIRYRCYDPRHPAWSAYGARGIGVWSGWTAMFEVFEHDVLAAIGAWPGPGYTLARIDDTANFGPTNVVWRPVHGDFTDTTSQRVLTATVRALAGELGRQAARALWRRP